MKAWTQTQVRRPDINSICSQFVGLSDIIKVVAWVFDVYLYFLYTCKISMEKKYFHIFLSAVLSLPAADSGELHTSTAPSGDKVTELIPLYLRRISAI